MPAIAQLPPPDAVPPLADALRAALPPLSEAAVPAAPARAYQHYYGLDLLPAGQCRLGTFAAAGQTLVGQLWLPQQPRGSLILLHGYYDHMGQYRHLIDWALQRQLAVLACDLPGHGLSSGPRASIDDFSRYQETLAALLAQAAGLQLPAPWHLCGQSTGGGIIADYLLHRPPPPELGQVLLLAPLLRPRSWPLSLLSYWLVSPFRRSIGRRFTVNSGDPAFIDFLRHHDPLQARELPTAWVGALARWIEHMQRAPCSPLQPWIVQGEADRTLDWRYNLRFWAQHFQSPQLLRLPAARHHLANETADIRGLYLDFLDKALSACPSAGA